MKVSYIKRILAVCLALIFVLSLATGCHLPTSPAAEEGFSIVTTNFALYDLAKAAAGPDVRVTMLISPGTESHDFEMTLSDMALLESCDLFIYMGGEGETWVYTALEAFSRSGVEIPSFCAFEAVLARGTVYEEELGKGMEAGEGAHDHEHQHASGEAYDSAQYPQYAYQIHDSHRYEGLDEHCWTSLQNGVVILRGIEEALEYHCGKEAVAVDAGAYGEKLMALDEKFRQLTAAVEHPVLLVADRFPFLYLTKAYGIDYYAAFAGCSSDTEPSLETVNYLLEQATRLGQPYIFVTELSSCTTAEAICDRLPGITSRQLHSCHNVTAEDFAAGITYLDLMEQNYQVLEALWNP